MQPLREAGPEPLLLVGGQLGLLGGQLFLVGSANRLHAGRRLSLGRPPCVEGQEHLFHQLGIVFRAGFQLRQAVAGILDGIIHRGAVDQVQHRPQGDAALPLALARALAGRLAPQVEESVGQRGGRVRQLGGAEPSRHARQTRLRARGGVDGVVEHLGRHPPRHRVRVIDLVVLVPPVGLDGMLIDAALGDQFQHVLGVEAAVDELLGEPFQQLRVTRRVAGADVVHRIDQAAAEQVAPQPVDEAAGEERVFLRGGPAGKLLAAAGGRRHHAGVIKGEFRRRSHARAQVRHFAGPAVEDDLDEGLSAFDGRPFDPLVLVLWVVFESDLGEVSRELVILVLRPAFERVVVALVAVEANAQEKLCGVLGRGARLAEHFVVGRRRVTERVAAGRQHLIGELIIRTVLRHGLPHPVPQGRRALVAEELAVHL